MDNLSSHKRRQIRQTIRRRRRVAAVPVPPTVADLNPIEQAFAKLKALLRKADARSIDAVNDVIGTLLERFSPEECANYFEEAGYRST